MSSTRLLLTNIFFWAIAAWAANVGAQPLKGMKFSHITPEQGLSNSTVEAIIQDHKGFLWFGTADGLNRYNGYELSVYKHAATDSTSISDNAITHLFEDSKKRIWIGTGNGLNRYDWEKDAFRQYRHVPGEPTSLPNNYINHVAEDALGRIWVAGPAGVSVLNERTGGFDRFSFLSRLNQVPASNEKVTCIHIDRDENVWIGTETNGLFIKDADGKVTHVSPARADGLNHHHVTAIKEDHQGNIWIGTNGGGINLKARNKKSFTYFRNNPKDPATVSNDAIKFIGVDRNNQVWIGTENGGLNLWDERTGAFVHVENDPANPFSISQKTVSSFCEDRQGNIWIGTHRGGVNRYSPQMDRFALLSQGVAGNNLSYKDVKTFYEDRSGNIYIGTDGGGINVWNRTRQRFQYHRHDPFDPHSIGSDAVLHIMEDHTGKIWVGTWGGGLNSFDPHTGTFRRYLHNPADPTSIGSNHVWKILEDSKKRLWVGTSYGGLHLFNPSTGQFKRVFQDADDTSWITGQHVYSLLEDKLGNIWIGTEDGGLTCMAAADNRFTNYFVQLQQNVYQPAATIRVLFKDSKDRLWVGQRGLYRFEYSKNVFTTAKCAYPLHDEMIQGIQEDNHGNLWISTMNGLIRYNPDDYSYKRFTTADGLQGLEFGPNACYKTRQGEMLFGGHNGFNIFHPDSILTNKTPPPVYLTDLQISNRSVRPGASDSPLTGHISEVESILLKHDQTAFAIEYAALNYIASENNQYAYLLEGFDKQWNHVGNTRKATYTNLNPGHYVFRVKASNNDGIWNEQGAFVRIVIPPPFWATWWFRTLVALVVVGAVSTYLWLYRNLEIKKISERKKEEMHQLQLQFFTNISHEFRTPLSLILGALERIREAVDPEKYYRVMENNTQRLTSLISELMDFRRVESGMLRLKIEPLSTNTFLADITADFHTIAESRQLSFSVISPNASRAIWCDRNVLEKILFNLLNNAFKYTDNHGRVSIRILDSLSEHRPNSEPIAVVKSPYEAAGYLYLLVSDTGIGISRDSAKHLFERFYRITDAHMGSGIGLAFVKSLVLLHKGVIYVYSEPGKGTDIIVGLPSQQHDYDYPLANPLHGAVIPDDKPTATSGDDLHHIPDTFAESSTVSDHFKHILLVDDHAELRAFLRESLESTYRITEAVDGVAALEMLQQDLPDLIISDLMMPRMDGIALCRQIKENDSLSHIPFLMLTAKDGLDSRLEGAAYGADFYFAKPISIKLLLLTINNIFRQHQQLRIHYLKDYQTEIRGTLHSSQDKEFMDRVLLLLEGQLENPDLHVEALCQQMGMSQSKFYKKLKDITGKNITEFIRTVRLKKAAHVLLHENVSVSQAMYMVGISSASYFTTAFKKEFGVTPSQYVKRLDLTADG